MNMLKNLKLKGKLLLSFFLITCISTIATTIFSIYYFSDKIKSEALLNMRKNIRVANLIYNNKKADIKNSAQALSDDGTLRLLVQFAIQNKIRQREKNIQDIKNKTVDFLKNIDEEKEDINEYKNFNEICTKYKISPREKEVLELLIQGLLNKEISGKLDISLSTVEFHVHNIYKKFKVQNKGELVNKIKS